MSLKQKTIAIAILLFALAVAGLLGVFSRDHEPRYQGKPLSYWLTLCKEDSRMQASPEFQKAEQAVRAIGTNALPYLLKWITYEPPPWRKKLPTYLPAIVAHNDTVRVLLANPSNQRAGLVGCALRILGTNAASAIPELEAMMKDKQRPDRAQRAMFALGCMGWPAIPALTNALADPQQTNRWQLIWALRLSACVTGTNAILPLLTAQTSNKDPQVRSTASIALKILAPQVLTNAPAK